MVNLNSILKPSALFFWSLIVIIPVVWPYLAKLEVKVFPVVKEFTVQNLSVVEDGMLIWVSLHKVRDCKYLGMEWYYFNKRVFFTTERREKDKSATSRVTGKHTIGPWFLEGASSMEGVKGYVQHQCHPLWVTRTKLYPPKSQEE